MRVTAASLRLLPSSFGPLFSLSQIVARKEQSDSDYLDCKHACQHQAKRERSWLTSSSESLVILTTTTTASTSTQAIVTTITRVKVALNVSNAQRRAIAHTLHVHFSC